MCLNYINKPQSIRLAVVLRDCVILEKNCKFVFTLEGQRDIEQRSRQRAHRSGLGRTWAQRALQDKPGWSAGCPSGQAQPRRCDSPGHVRRLRLPRCRHHHHRHSDTQVSSLLWCLLHLYIRHEFVHVVHAEKMFPISNEHVISFSNTSVFYDLVDNIYQVNIEF